MTQVALSVEEWNSHQHAKALNRKLTVTDTIRWSRAVVDQGM